MTFDVRWRSEGADDAAGDVEGFEAILEAVEEEGELVAADSGD